MKTYRLVALVGLMLVLQTVRGQEKPVISFIENKRQWEEVIKFKSEMRGGAMFFETNAITYSFVDPEYLEKIAALKSNRISRQKSSIKIDSLVECYAYRMQFEDANKNTVIEGHKPFQEYHNYYLGSDPERWSTDVKLYEQIEYYNLYKGINLLFYEYAHTYKYEFKIAPEANPEQIRMRYEGADKLFLRKGGLIIKVGKHESEERKPFAYQIDEKGKKIEIPCDFVIEGKIVRFALGNYDKSKELIIDPTLIFSSYSGSTMDNWGFTATYDNAGNLYGGGTISNYYGGIYPTTLGCYQDTFGGGYRGFSSYHPCDIAITKFSTDGTQRLFSTYLGGKSADVPHSMIVSNNDELYVLATTSSKNYPKTKNAYDTTFRSGPPIINTSSGLTNGIEYENGSCIVISRFSADGKQLLGSTFFGGSGTDGLSKDNSLVYNYSDEFRGEIQLDAANNVYIVSSTSSIDLPTTSGVFQKNYGGGTQDGCIAKFSYDLQTLIWCSYFGGSGADAIYSMSLDKNDNLYICGGTTSNNIPITLGSIQPTQPGGIDGFIAQISASGRRVNYATYYGREGYDQAYLVTLDKHENIYVMGQTDTTAAAWVQNAAWQNGRGQFISKLSNNLSNVIWSTSFGSTRRTPDISPTALMVDVCGNIHISGWGGDLNRSIYHLSTDNLPITNDAYQSGTDGADFYFISIEKDASNLLYATFFGGYTKHLLSFPGGEHVDGGTSRFDKKGIIYQAVCAGCRQSNLFPTYPSNVVSTRNNSSNCNLGVIKLDYGLKSVVADFDAPNTICAPDSITVTNRSYTTSNRVTYAWNFGDGRASTDSAPADLLYTKAGTYTITLIVTDSSSCNISDTCQKKLSVMASANKTNPPEIVCKGDRKQIGPPPASNVIYRWEPTIGLTAYNISNPEFIDTVSRKYTLYMDNGVCTDTLTQQVNISILPPGKQQASYGCIGDSLRLLADTSGGGNYYVFSNFSNLLDTLNRPQTTPYINIVIDKNIRNYYVFRTDGACKVMDTIVLNPSSFNISIDSVPRICTEDSVRLSVNISNSVNGGTFAYQWTPISAISGNSRTATPWAKPKDSTYLVVLVDNGRGCLKKDSVLVKVSNLKTNPTQKNISCYGLTDGSIAITTYGGIAPYAYSWLDTNLKTNTRTNLKKGTYTVQIIDQYKCSFSQTFTITEPTQLFVHLEDTVGLVFCDDASTGQAKAVGTGGTPPYRYAWISGDTTAFIDGLYAGNYFLTLFDKNGCKDTITFHVRDTSDMEVRDTSNGISCFGKCDGDVLIEVVKAVEPYEILWKTGETVHYRDSLCAGAYDILVIDDQHCRRRLFPIVANIESITIRDAIIVHPYCHGLKDGYISVTTTGGKSPYKYYWNRSPIEGDSILPDLTDPGQYSLRIIDSNDCVFDTIFTLPNYDTLSATIKKTGLPCIDACIGKAEIHVFGGVEPYSYDWSNGGTNSLIDNLCIGTYSVVVYDSNHCELTAQVEIGIDSSLFPKVVAWADTTEIYRSQSITLYGTDLGNNFTYEWTPDEGLSTPKKPKTTATPQNTTIYTYTATDKHGCQKSDTILITVKDVICEEPYVFVPNSFSPNGDDINDILYVRGVTLIKIDFAVYDRLGERIFATTDQNIGWDGTYKGKPCQPGVYVYYLTAVCIGNAEYVKKGNITLMR